MGSDTGVPSPSIAAPRHQLELVAADAHIDALDHVSNLVYLEWVMRAAESHSESVGLDMAAYRSIGGVFVVKRHEIDYLRSAVVGDRIHLITWVERWRGASSLRCTSIRRASDDEELAAARTTWVYVSFAHGRPRRIPAEVVAAFGQPTATG